MSYDDRGFMLRGYRVRHSYRKRPGCLGVCERCGVKRRKTSSGWEWQWHGMWSSSNPPCVQREASHG